MTPYMNPLTHQFHNEVHMLPKPNVKGLTINLYHELSHLVPGTNDDHGYDLQVLLDLAVKHSAAAIIHAANGDTRETFLE
jgi:hypothetical protein